MNNWDNTFSPFEPMFSVCRWKEEGEIEKLAELKALIENLTIDTRIVTDGASNLIQVRGYLLFVEMSVILPKQPIVSYGTSLGFLMEKHLHFFMQIL